VPLFALFFVFAVIHEAISFSCRGPLSLEEAAALLLEGVELADDIFDCAFKKVGHAREAIPFRRCIAQQLAVQRQDIKLKRRAAIARRILIISNIIISQHTNL